MKINIEYGKNIIVAVRSKEEWAWFVTEKDYWFLDLVKLENAFLIKGYRLLNQGDYSDRFDISILDETTADKFLHEIIEYKVSKDDLSELILNLNLNDTDYKDSVLEFTPSLFVDFDKRILVSSFPEPASFENYIPDGWIGYYKNFLDQVPVTERYWVINGKDYFHTQS